tara:strand:- start:14159 stop:14860 length:702 start_codon:yes stop_codon:yes gene_type:complete
MENKAIVAVWITVHKKNIEEFRKWHNCEHSTDRLEGPGFNLCLRYNSFNGTSEFRILNIFEGKNLETFNSEYYLESRNNPTPWTQKCMSFVKDPIRVVYELTDSYGEIAKYQSPYIHTVLFNLEGSKDIFLKNLEEKIKRNLLQSKNFSRFRIWSKNKELSEGKTKESEIQGNSASKHDYLLFSEIEDDREQTQDKIKQIFDEIKSQNQTELKIQKLTFEKWSLDFIKTKTKN